MRLWVWSDLHLEAQASRLPDRAPDADVAVCAGDLCQAPGFAAAARAFVDRYRMPLVFVPGNHEYFGPSDGGSGRGIGRDAAELAEVSRDSAAWPFPVHVLDDSFLDLCGVRFVGGTLWTDFGTSTLRPEDAAWVMHAAHGALPDFGRIRKDDGSRLSPQDMLDMHLRTRSFMRTKLTENFGGPVVAVTHYPPHPDCTARAYGSRAGGDAYGCGEAAFGDVLNGAVAPALWVSGHAHVPFDVGVGATRAVCNPAGYQADPAERANGFDPGFVVTV